MVLGTTVMGALITAFVYTIGTGDVRLTLMVAFVAIAPALLILALKRSYLFPYGLYVVLVPFDNMLRITGAGTLTKFLGIASTLFIIVYAARRKGLNPPPLTLYLWCGYLLWLMLTVMWTPDTSQGVVDIEQMLSLIAMYAVLAVAPVEERDVRAICACIIIGGIAASVYGIYLLHDSAVSMMGDAGRIMINVDNRSIDPNHFANALLAPIALSLTSLLHARKPVTILGSLFALAVLTAGVLMSLSREALLGCILIVLVTVAFSKRRVIGIAIGLPLLLLTPVLFPQIGVRMSDAFSTGGAGRMSIWQVGWMAFQQHPFIGWGAGGFAAAYDRYYLTVFQFYNAGWSRASHNTVIHAAVELGIIGVVLMTIAFVSSFRQFRGITRGTPLYDLRVAFTASLVALGFVAVFIDLANYKYVWIVLTTIAQLRTVARMQRTARAPAAIYEAPPAPRHSVRRRAVPAAP
jgi:O-antigen ligase